ncbi:MAG TPA: class I SAM-dependent methyltransferase [Baekduia sp.]|nr:class I SAM-dependent methyltransferase [Baekduia sp.]
MENQSPAAAYDPLAPHYEAFVGAPRYAEWVAALLQLAADHGLTGGRALDVGCGTGRSLQALLAAGFDAAGCDPSPAMLREARAQLAADVQLGASTLPEPLPTGPAVDLITAINDVINYVEPSALEAAFAQIAARLRPGGVFLFDANTARTFTSFFGASFCRDAGSRFFVWESLPADGPTHAADLHAFVADPSAPGCWTRSVSRHVQHHHRHVGVRAALAATGFDLLAVHGQREDGGIDGDADDAVHTKRIYLAALR